MIMRLTRFSEGTMLEEPSSDLLQLLKETIDVFA